MNVIRFSDVEKNYVKSNFKLTVNDLVLHRNESISFIGMNGSGKTTMMRLVCGLTIQDEGTVTVFEEVNTSKNNKHTCKFVLESGQGYYDYLTAQENIEYFLTLNKINLKKELNALKKLVEYFNFDSELEKKTKALSQGNRQKMSLIIALMTKPKILCLDEPTNGLDIGTTNKLIEVLKFYKKTYDMTILYTSQDIHFIRNLSDRSIIMSEGRIIGDTTRISDILLPKIIYDIEISLDEYTKLIESDYDISQYSMIINEKSIKSV